MRETDVLPSAAPTVARSAPELAAELRREFERALFERYGQPPGQDPVLAALFHAAAAQLARVYDEAEQVFPEAVFDDLVAGLGMPPREAQPAQTVVRITGVTDPEVLSPETPLLGFTPQSERLVFVPDVPMLLSGSTLAFAGVMEGGQLHAVAGATVPGGQGVPVAENAVALDPPFAGTGPALVLAFDAGPAHLDGLGLFLDTGENDDVLAGALARSAAGLLDAERGAHERGVLLSHAGAGGVRMLESAARARVAGDDAGLLRGPYGPQCWVFPNVPEALRARGRPPRAVAGALGRLLPPEHAPAYGRPLTWVQVQLPAEVTGAAARLRRVVANCACASNLDVQSQRIGLGQIGEAVTCELRTAPGRHLITVLGVVGEQESEYSRDSGETDEVPRGRYRARGSTVRVRPARGATGRFDRHATAHALYTDGANGNAIRPGDVRQFGTPLASPTAEVLNLTPARGGGAPPPAAPPRVRFAELLRTRERVVTPSDVDISARVYEPRVLATAVESSVSLDGGHQPRRVEVVTAAVRASDFDDPDADFVRLAAGLERHLQQRLAVGTHVRVRVQAVDAPQVSGTAR